MDLKTQGIRVLVNAVTGSRRMRVNVKVNFFPGQTGVCNIPLKYAPANDLIENILSIYEIYHSTIFFLMTRDA